MSVKVKQRDITDCGAACLASVASYYKLEMPVARIRQIAGTDTRGTNVLGMVKAAEQLGFSAKGVKGIQDSLIKYPCLQLLILLLSAINCSYIIMW
jgi:ATP-binding cassette subfamily B protein